VIAGLVDGGDPTLAADRVPATLEFPQARLAGRMDVARIRDKDDAAARVEGIAGAL